MSALSQDVSKKNPTPCWRSRKGFSLVEVLLALAVLGIAILTIVGLLNAAFESVSSNLQTSQALNVYSRVDRAFSNIDEFTDSSGSQVYTQNTSDSKPRFNYVYDLLKTKTGQSWGDALFLVCYNRRLNPEEEQAPQLVMQVILSETESSLPDKSELDALDFEGNVYLVRVFISPQLAGQRTTMNNDGEVLGSTYTVGGALPSTAETYALAYLPVTVEVYPYSVGASQQSESQIPILSQLLVISR